MSEDGTTFTIDMAVTGQAGLDAAARSVDKFEASGDAASKAIVATSDAIKAGEASYRQAEKSADAAAKALERIGVAAAAQRTKLQAASEAGDDKAASKAATALRNLVAQQRIASTTADEAKAALSAEAAALDKLRNSGEKAGKAEGEHEIKLGGLARGLKHLGGPLGESGAELAQLGHAWEKVTGAFGSKAGVFVGATVAIVAFAAAVFELSKKLVESVVEIARFGVETANANRSASLLAQGIARSVTGGERLDDTLTDLTKRLPLTREELSSTAERLANAGLRGNDLTTALEKSAIAAAKLKFGPDFEEEMLSLDEQSKVFHTNLEQIFGGLKIEGLLRGLQKLGALFDADTSSGKAIKVVFESLFQPLVDGLTNAVPKIERFFLEFEILALKALIAIKPYGSTILKVVEAFAIGTAVLIAFAAVPVALVVAALGVLVTLFGAVVAGIGLLGAKLYSIGSAIVGFFGSLDLTAMGKALIDGLVNGITNGAKAVLDAMTGVVHGAIDGAKKLLGIASPSRVFAEIGEQTGAGMSQGVERSAGGVQSSLESMVSPTSAPGGAAPAAPAQAAGSSGDRSVTVIINGVQGAEDMIEQIRAEVTRLLEGDAAQLGAVAA